MSLYDSDDSEFSDYESNVHLGLPDGGPISDLDDKTIEISRIGGQPVRPSFCKLIMYINYNLFSLSRV